MFYGQIHVLYSYHYLQLTNIVVSCVTPYVHVHLLYKVSQYKEMIILDVKNLSDYVYRQGTIVMMISTIAKFLKSFIIF